MADVRVIQMIGADVDKKMNLSVRNGGYARSVRVVLMGLCSAVRTLNNEMLGSDDDHFCHPAQGVAAISDILQVRCLSSQVMGSGQVCGFTIIPGIR